LPFDEDFAGVFAAVFVGAFACDFDPDFAADFFVLDLVLAMRAPRCVGPRRMRSRCTTATGVMNQRGLPSRTVPPDGGDGDVRRGSPRGAPLAPPPGRSLP
jgi:hypothetical protein